MLISDGAEHAIEGGAAHASRQRPGKVQDVAVDQVRSLQAGGKSRVDCRIYFKDFAIIADNWLDDELSSESQPAMTRGRLGP